MSIPPQPTPTVAPDVYDREYFLTECEGYAGFSAGELTARLREALERVTLRPGMKVLDVGCGRGEIVQMGWRQGALVWGIDYASAAVAIAREHLQAQQVDSRAALAQANAKQLPFAANAFDVAYMLDIVEHLYPVELETALRETYRVLKPGGVLFVHTAPNIWYYRFGYPPYRWLRSLQGKPLPRNPKDRFPSHNKVHVNEQSVFSLAQALKTVGFKSYLWVDQSQDRLEASDKHWVRGLAEFVTHNFILKWIFCGDIYAVARKPAV